MIRLGDKIRLTADDQQIWRPMNHGMPLKVKTVAEFNRFLDRCATAYPGNTPEERFARSTLHFYRIKD